MAIKELKRKIVISSKREVDGPDVKARLYIAKLISASQETVGVAAGSVRNPQEVFKW